MPLRSIWFSCDYCHLPGCWRRPGTSVYYNITRTTRLRIDLIFIDRLNIRTTRLRFGGRYKNGKKKKTNIIVTLYARFNKIRVGFSGIRSRFTNRSAVIFLPPSRTTTAIIRVRGAARFGKIRNRHVELPSRNFRGLLSFCAGVFFFSFTLFRESRNAFRGPGGKTVRFIWIQRECF